MSRFFDWMSWVAWWICVVALLGFTVYVADRLLTRGL